jgi:hypothetical protein
VGCSGIGIEHLLGVTVVGGDEQEITSFLTGFVDCADCCIRLSDSFNGRVKYTCVADLQSKKLRINILDTTGRRLTISGGAKLHITNSLSPFLSTSATLSATPWTLIFGSLS